MNMKSATGRWVSGDDFFDRGPELKILEERVSGGNHILLTGQRRMGKTSIARELGRRLESGGWVCFFADVEGATCPEDAITYIAERMHHVRPISSRMKDWGDWAVKNTEEISAREFRVKFRAKLNPGNWQRKGRQLIHDCAGHDKPVLLVLDELPIFLKRMLRDDDGPQRVEGFLSWLRGTFQELDARSPVLIVSGSIGLAPLVGRLGIPDRINYLYPFRLGPWNREVSVQCFERLAKNHGLTVGTGVADAVYEKLGLGIPHHVQSFSARLREFVIMEDRSKVDVEDIEEVYRTGMLGPSGQNDLSHYETRLKDALEGESYTIAMEVLAEAATQDLLTADARRRFETWYSRKIDDAPSRIADVLEVLAHDGYLEADEDDYRFPSRLLKDWWSARFKGHHQPFESR